MADEIVLVLGAGGAPGWMWHAGVLEGLAEHGGWDGRRADLIIGTSAGSIVGAAMRAGASPREFAEAVDHPPSPSERAEVMQEMRSRRRSFRPLSPGLARHALPGGAGLSVALAGLAPAGLFPTWPLTGRGRVTFPSTWDRLWIPTTRASDGRAVIFGRDDHEASVVDAVEASCAFPGLFEPKPINGHRYLDGGAVSPTHADLSLDRSARLVVISAPLSRQEARPLPRLARSRLAAERAKIEAAGVSTLVVTPPAESNALFRAYPRRDQASGRVIRAMAAAAARRALATAPDSAALLSA